MLFENHHEEPMSLLTDAQTSGRASHALENEAENEGHPCFPDAILAERVNEQGEKQYLIKVGCT
jgi:hypothetical protein